MYGVCDNGGLQMEQYCMGLDHVGVSLTLYYCERFGQLSCKWLWFFFFFFHRYTIKDLQASTLCATRSIKMENVYNKSS